jgi:excisionase family DNA binding protein
MPIDWIDMPEVARICGVTPERAYELARTGILPAVRFGRQVRVDRNKLMTWIEQGGQAYSGGWKKTCN